MKQRQTESSENTLLTRTQPIATGTVNFRSEPQFISISLEAIGVDTVPGFDIYVNLGHELVLYSASDQLFTAEVARKLIDKQINKIYISGAEEAICRRYIECRIGQIVLNSQIDPLKRSAILYRACSWLMEQVLINPTSETHIRRALDLSAHLVGYILSGRESFLSLLNATSFDYYTHTHSVNVCIFSIALAHQSGIEDQPSLNELAIGALLHDIGKARVSERILTKRSALSSIEFEIMKKHPQWGVELLRETNLLPEAAYNPVLEHHERGEGKGYPSGLELDKMHIFSRIVAIADSFDAMTTDRVFSGAMDTFPAIKRILNSSGAYDDLLVRAFCELMGPTGLAKI